MRTASTPTEEQLLCLEAIDRLTRQKGYPPTLQEIADALRSKKTAVQSWVESLKRRRMVFARYYRQRTLTITPEGRAELERRAQKVG